MCINALPTKYTAQVHNSWVVNIFSHSDKLIEEPLITNTRLVCTNLNVFFMLNVNMVMKIQILENYFLKMLEYLFLPFALDNMVKG